MEQPLYQLIEWTARANGLLALFSANQDIILNALTILAWISCFLGFYIYRGVVSGIVFLGIALVGGCCVGPAWGAQAGATFGAVLGVSVGFLAFRWYKLGAAGLCAAIAADRTLMALGEGSWMLPVALALAAGIFVFLFPLWGICGCTALWGGTTLSAHLAQTCPFLARWGAAGEILLGATLFLLGLLLQLLLFRRQKLFARIMPRRMEYALSKRKKGVPA